ncbi:ribosomal protein S5, C-terminal domain-containing protein [Aspergillus unguis]
MSFARPARCLFCSFSRAATGPRVPRRGFQLSATHFADKADKNDKALKPVKNGKTLQQLTEDMKPEDFKAYTNEEKAWLKEHYTPEQLAAIEAGEAAIDPKDMAEQFRVRKDPMKLKYLDDFSVIEPGIDRHVRAPESNSDYNATLKTEDDFVDDFAKFIAEMPEDASVSDWVRFAETNRMTIGKEENELNPNTSLVPDLFEPGENLEGRNKKPHVYYQDPDNQAVMKDNEPSDELKTLMKVTGHNQNSLRALKTKSLVTRYVVNQTRLGKIRSPYVLAVAGNGEGLLGIGEGKSHDATAARIQATYRAIRNMKPVPRYENRTIFGDVTGKSGAVELKLMSRPPGFGLRCQSLIYELCRAAGIDDLAARVDRSRNKMNTVKAAYQALMSQRDPEEIARARGKKLVDVRKVYYSGKSTQTMWGPQRQR